MSGSSARPCGVSGAAVLETPRHLAPPPVDPRGVRLGWRSALQFVDRIVDGAAEVPHRDDGAPLGRGQHEERVVEAGVAGPWRPSGAVQEADASERRPPAAVKVGRSRTRRSPAARAFEDPHAAEPGGAQLVLRGGPAPRRHRPARIEQRAVRRHLAGARAPTATPASAAAARSSVAAAASHRSPARRGGPRPSRCARSCQKFVSCSAVQTASDARSSASSR